MQTRLTMQDVFEAVAEQCSSDCEVVATIAHLVNSGRLQFHGKLAGAWIDLSDPDQLPHPAAA